MAEPEQREGFLVANRNLVERYESLDAGQRAEVRVDLGFLPAPISVGEAGRLRLSEFSLHAWDVRPDGEIAPAAVPLLLDGFTQMLAWIAKPDTLAGKQAELLVTLTDPATTYGLTLGDKVALGDAPANPDGELRAPAAAWLRLLTGRLAPERTPASVTVTGPVTLDDLRKVFPGL